jgi:hypothetical protein
MEIAIFWELLQLRADKNWASFWKINGIKD